MAQPPVPVIALPPDAHALQRHLEYGGITWQDYINPGRDQLLVLRERYAIHPLHVEDIISRMQRPKLDENDEPEYIFLVLHFPVFNEMTRLSTTSEIDILVGPSYLITAHDTRLKPFMRLVQDACEEQVQAHLMRHGTGYLLYRIVETLINACFPMLQRLDEKLDRLEEEVFTRSVRTIVEEISFLRRDIMSMRRIIRPNIAVLRRLETRERPFLRLDEEAYFGDLNDGMARVWDMLEEQKEIIEGLDATLSSLTSHRINQDMKTFTLISVIILPMTLVASILGMNVYIPMAEHPAALIFSVLLMFALAGAMYLFFRYKHWV